VSIEMGRSAPVDLREAGGSPGVRPSGTAAMQARMRTISYFCASCLVVACGGASSAPSPGPETPRTLRAEIETGSAKPGGPSEADVNAFLASRAGEVPAEESSMQGVTEATPEENAILEKCRVAKEKALAKSQKQSAGKQIDAALKAMDGADKRCFDLAL